MTFQFRPTVEGATTQDQQQDAQVARDVENQFVTFLFIQLNKIPGSEPEGATLAFELAEYRNTIKRVGRENKAITRILSESAALMLFPCAANAEAPSRHGIHAAVTLRQQLEALNRQRLAEQQVPFRIGIGAHTDAFMTTPAKGRERLLDLQASIENAEGLSQLNWQAPFPAIFVSENALQGLGTSPYRVQNLGKAFAPNHTKPLTVYALM